MLHRRARLIGLATLIVALSGVAAPAAAGGVQFPCEGDATNSPDGRSRLDDGPFEGAGEYPRVAQNKDIEPGEQAKYRMKWENVSDVVQTIKVRRTDLPVLLVKDPGYSIGYTVRGVDVTARIKEGRAVKFRDLLPGASTTTLKLVITNRNDADFNGGVRQGLLGSYKGAADPIDCDHMDVQANIA